MQIEITTTGQVLQAIKGDNLYRALAGVGLLDAACGGVGRCGKCRVRFITTRPTPQPRETIQLSAVDLADGWRLACLHHVETDLRLELPQQGSAAVIGSFWGSSACDFMPDRAYGYGLAVDIGTTSLVVSLVNLRDGAQLAVATCLNSQKSFGQDVISRIHYAQTTPDGTLELQATVVGDIKVLLAEVCATSKIEAWQISLVSVAANPTMVHLLAGVNPAPLGRVPYTLVCEGSLYLQAQTLGLNLADEAIVYCLPAVSAYLGGDIVGGMLAVALDTPGPTRLFIDIGTNGEIVLAQKDKFFSCSTAAGPALEGMNIHCGMRATEGAVDYVRIERKTVRYTTIGNGVPCGLTGSGLLAAISELRMAGLVDASGRLQPKEPVIERQGQRCLVIDKSTGIVLTQGDIRHVQLAKGAIRSGIDTLLSATDCEPEAVNEVLVAGGFGSHLSEQSLIETTMLPRQFAGKIRYLGNTALEGARLCLLSAAMRERTERMMTKVTYIELAQQADYQQRFIESMHFD